MALRLAPGEQVMFQGHPSWRSIIAFYIKGLFVVLIAAFVVGIVTNITNVGCFVDIGVHQDGLVHVSQLADRVLRGFFQWYRLVLLPLSD